jgi:uncharacterized protein (TIGR02145 family)
MKEVCGVNGTNPNGLSKPLASGGFSVLVTGYARNGSTFNFGNTSIFWSSSTPGTAGAWYRALYINSAAVVRSDGWRSDMWSVRCKKD